mgnify:CR=1 FL=1
MAKISADENFLCKNYFANIWSGLIVNVNSYRPSPKLFIHKTVVGLVHATKPFVLESI